MLTPSASCQRDELERTTVTELALPPVTIDEQEPIDAKFLVEFSTLPPFQPLIGFKMININIANEISHLSPIEIEELYQKYLEGEKNSVLTGEYGINISPNKLIKILPPIKLDKVFCPYCGIPMFTKRRVKSAGAWDVPPAECCECDHKTFSEKTGFRRQLCNCQECTSISKQKDAAKKRERIEKIRAKYAISDRKAVEYSELNFSHKLTLLTLFRMQTNEDFDHILSLDDPSRTGSFSPTSQMDVECLKELFSCGAIIIDPESRAEAFVEDEDFDSFYITKVRWIPNIALNGLERAALNETYTEIYNELKSGIQEQWKDEIFKTLFRIAREEVLQYVHIRADELKVDFTAENKTREVVNQLLQSFSVSEIYYFVKNSVENAHIYYSKGYASNKRHAANTIPNKILSLGERALNENWSTYKYNRDSRAPRSSISIVFYDFLLQENDSGFSKSPGKHWEQELFPRNFCENIESDNNSISCSQCCSINVEAKMAGHSLEVSCKLCGNIDQFSPNS